MENVQKIKIEDDRKNSKWSMTKKDNKKNVNKKTTKNIKMEDDQPKNKIGRQPEKSKWKTTQKIKIEEDHKYAKWKMSKKIQNGR